MRGAAARDAGAGRRQRSRPHRGLGRRHRDDERHLGAHPALSFRTTTITEGTTTRDVVAVRRYLAGELYPWYAVTSNTSVGAYWLYSYGIDRDATRNTNYLAIRVSHARALRRDYLVRLSPQAYYLKLDDRIGCYANGAITLARRGAPISLSSSATRSLRTDVAGEAFIWNLSLSYAFD
jgi:hypothetical protein